jgi:hypothetical protein
MSIASNTIRLAGATPAGAGSAPTRSAGLLRKTWQRLAAVSTGTVKCLREAIYLSHATSRADLDRRIRHLESAARDRKF